MPPKPESSSIAGSATARSGSARPDTSTSSKKNKKSQKKKRSHDGPKFDSLSEQQRARGLIEAVTPLLELFSTVDVVFSEDDSMQPSKRQISLGRLYEAWKQARAQLDPDWRDHGPRSPLGKKMGHPATVREAEGFTG